MNRNAYLETSAGAKAILPLALGVFIYGLAFGVLAAQAGLALFEVSFMGVLVFAGSAQIVAVERLAAGAGVVAALMAACALNLRLVLITASVRDFFAHRPLWQQIMGAHLTTDENWALTLATRSQGENAGFWFLVGGGILLLLAWISSTTLGVIFAGWIPDPQTYALDFAFTAAFIAIARSLWRSRADLIPWISAAGVVIVLVKTGILASSWALVLGGISGAVVAGLQRDV